MADNEWQYDGECICVAFQKLLLNIDRSVGEMVS